MRISRVPKSLRIITMGELFTSQLASEAIKARRAAENGAGSRHDVRKVASPISAPSHVATSKDYSSASRGTKRTRYESCDLDGMGNMAKFCSDDSYSSEDKENGVQMELSNPKKRTKTTKKAESPKRSVNARLQENQILSPKSSNSQTLPKSPIRPRVSPGKSFLARPLSPLKGTGPQNKVSGTLIGLVEKAKSIRTLPSKKTTVGPVASGARVKKGAQIPTTQTQTKDRDTSNSSSNSAGTVVKAAKGRKDLAAKKMTSGTAARKVAPKPEATTAARRTLRKRN